MRPMGVSKFLAPIAICVLCVSACTANAPGSPRSGPVATVASHAPGLNSSGSPLCPPTYSTAPRGPLKPQVPSPPTADGTAGRLVPASVPTSAVLCRYSVLRQEPSTLEGQVELSGLDAVPGDLALPAKLPGESHACTAVGGPSTPYLLRLDYPSGTVWVGSHDEVNACVDTTNGAFTSSIYIGRDLAASYVAHRWQQATHLGAGALACYERVGRAGQEHVLVPPGAVRISVCRDSSELAPVTEPERIRNIVRLLNAPSATPSKSGCQGTVTHSRRLLFEYRSGRNVVLDVLQGCSPAAYTNSLAINLTGKETAKLLRLTG